MGNYHRIAAPVTVRNLPTGLHLGDRLPADVDIFLTVALRRGKAVTSMLSTADTLQRRFARFWPEFAPRAEWTGQGTTFAVRLYRPKLVGFSAGTFYAEVGFPVTFI